MVVFLESSKETGRRRAETLPRAPGQQVPAAPVVTLSRTQSSPSHCGGVSQGRWGRHSKTVVDGEAEGHPEL